MKYILEKAPLPAKLDSIILISALVDQAFTSLGQIDHFCAETGKSGNGFGNAFNSSECAAMKRAAPACERAGKTCRESGGLASCRQAMSKCGDVARWFGEGVGKGGNNPYDGLSSFELLCSGYI